MNFPTLAFRPKAAGGGAGCGNATRKITQGCTTLHFQIAMAANLATR